MLKRSLLALAACILLTPLMLTAQVPDTVSETYTWAYPTTGSPVMQFVVQTSTDGAAWETVTTVVTNQVTLDLPVLEDHLVRVAAQDVLGRQGIWSVPSDVYVPDNGEPGACGKPGRGT